MAHRTECRPRFVLQAVSQLALSFADSGSADLKLVQNTKLGRNVARGEGYRLKQDWVQFSQNHCRIYCQGSSDPSGVSWFVEDTSTNGTWVNDVRVPKHSSVAIKEGDLLRLSTPPGEVLEYKLVSVLEPVVEQKGDNYSSVANVSNSIQKRKVSDLGEEQQELQLYTLKRVTRGPSASPEVHDPQDVRTPCGNATPGIMVQPGSGGRSSSGGCSGRRNLETHAGPDSAAALAHFERSNQELRKKLDSFRIEIEESRQTIRSLQDQHTKEKEIFETKIRDSERQVEERYTARIEAFNAELASVKLSSKSSHGRISDLEARLAAEVDGRLQSEKLNTELKDELQDRQCKVARVQEELETYRQRLATVRNERDDNEMRRQQEAEQRKRLEEHVAALGQQIATQQQALDAAHHATEHAKRQAQEMATRVEEAMAARGAMEREMSEQSSKLQAAARREECLKEQLQEDREASILQHVRMGKVKQLHTTLLSSFQGAFDKAVKDLVHLGEQVDEASSNRPKGGDAEMDDARGDLQVVAAQDDFRNWVPTSTCLDGMALTPAVGAHLEMTQVGFDAQQNTYQAMTQAAIQPPLDLHGLQDASAMGESPHGNAEEPQRLDGGETAPESPTIAGSHVPEAYPQTEDCAHAPDVMLEDEAGPNSPRHESEQHPSAGQDSGNEGIQTDGRFSSPVLRCPPMASTMPHQLADPGTAPQMVTPTEEAAGQEVKVDADTDAELMQSRPQASTPNARGTEGTEGTEGTDLGSDLDKLQPETPSPVGVKQDVDRIDCPPDVENRSPVRAMMIHEDGVESQEPEAEPHLRNKSSSPESEHDLPRDGQNHESGLLQEFTASQMNALDATARCGGSQGYGPGKVVEQSSNLDPMMMASASPGSKPGASIPNPQVPFVEGQRGESLGRFW